MRVLSAVVPLALLFTVDVQVNEPHIGLSEAHAADFRGRIKRVRIRERRTSHSFQVVTETPSGPNAAPLSAEVQLRALEGSAPASLTSDLAEVSRDDARFGFSIPQHVPTGALIVVVKSGDEVVEMPLELLVDNPGTNGFGEAQPLPNSEDTVRARIDFDGEDGDEVDVRIVARGGVASYGVDDVQITVLDEFPDVQWPLVSDEQTTVRTFEVGIEDNPDDPMFGAYVATATLRDADGLVSDFSELTLDVGLAPTGARIERSALRRTGRGGTALVTQVSTADDGPIRLETWVESGEGEVVLGGTFEQPQWTERQFTSDALGFDDDPSGSEYLVIMTPTDAEGNPVGPGQEVVVVAEQPDENNEVDMTFFNDERAQIALLPHDDGMWGLFVRAVGDEPVASWDIRFEEPFEGPAPDALEVQVDPSRVWRQFRQVDQAVEGGEEVRVVSLKVEDGSGQAIQASAMQAEGVALRTDRTVEDIEGFMQSLTRPNSAIRARRSRRIRARR